MKVGNYLKKTVTIGYFSFLIIPIAFGQTKKLMYETPVGNNISGYYEYLPATYSSQTSKKYPLIIFMHGFGLTGNGKKGILEYIVNYGTGTIPYRSFHNGLPSSFVVGGQQVEYILITPQFLVEPFYNGASYESDISSLISYCKSHYRIDEKKVYLTGQSAGAYYALMYASASEVNASQIAAVVSTSPGAGASSERGTVLSSGGVSVWVSVSQFDEIFPDDLSAEYNAASDWINVINNATPPPITSPVFFVIPGQHTHNEAAFQTYDPNTLVNGKNVYQWMLQYSKQSPVPVSGLEIHANSSNEFINITWKTHTEINNAGFRVERSLDGNKFSQIGYVKGNNSSSEGSYNFKDESPAIGSNYYRIVQVDMNGRTSISSVVHADFQSGQLIKVYPNPVTDILNLDFGSLNKNVIIQIFDNTGSLVKEAAAGNQHNTSIEVSKLSKGYYHGSINSEGKTIHFSFIKQ